jgi:hypothetical protein
MPKRIEYYSLEPSGFGNAVNVGPRIILYSKSKTLQILRNSLLYQNSDTVQVVIDLIQEMNDLRR